MKILASLGPVSIINGALAHWANHIEICGEGHIIAIKAQHGAMEGNLLKELQGMPLAYKDLLRQRKACVVYEWIEEAEPYPGVIEQIECFCQSESVALDLIWYLTGNFSATCHKINIRAIPLYLAVASWAIPAAHANDTNLAKTHVFLCFMRNPHTHRWLTLFELANQHLLAKGLVSFYGTKEDYAVYKGPRLDPLLLERLPLTVDVQPKELDRNTLTPRIQWNSGMGSELYQKTHVSLVVESHIDRNLLTEKICKPLAYGHPFIVVGGQNYLSTLRGLGFQTFGQWWDEGYNMVSTDYNRIKAVIGTLLTISQWSDDAWSDFHMASHSVIKHNQELIRSEKFMNKVHELLEEIRIPSLKLSS